MFDFSEEALLRYSRHILLPDVGIEGQERIRQGRVLVVGAAALGYEVNIFFTFWGLDAIKRRTGRAFVGKGFLPRLFGYLMGGLHVAPCSRFNFGCIGPRLFRHLMRKNRVATLEELVEAAKALGIRLYACEMAAQVLGLQKSDFIPEVKEVVGVASFLKLSEGGRTLFI